MDSTDLAHRIAAGFLVPACRYQPTEGESWDHHAQWKPVNQAAGIIAGYVAGFDPAIVDRLRLAQNLMEASIDELASDDLEVGAQSVFSSKIAGADGLPKRVAACLLALGVES